MKTKIGKNVEKYQFYVHFFIIKKAFKMVFVFCLSRLNRIFLFNNENFSFFLMTLFLDSDKFLSTVEKSLNYAKDFTQFFITRDSTVVIIKKF